MLRSFIKSIASGKSTEKTLVNFSSEECSSMSVNGTTYYCPSKTSTVSIHNGSMNCDGVPAKTYCDMEINSQNA
jgi:hypothetical protein